MLLHQTTCDDYKLCQDEQSMLNHLASCDECKRLRTLVMEHLKNPPKGKQ